MERKWNTDARHGHGWPFFGGKTMAKRNKWTRFSILETQTVLRNAERRGVDLQLQLAEANLELEQVLVAHIVNIQRWLTVKRDCEDKQHAANIAALFRECYPDQWRLAEEHLAGK